MDDQVTDDELRRGLEALIEMGYHPQDWLEGADALRQRALDLVPKQADPPPPPARPVPRRRYNARVFKAEIEAIKTSASAEESARIYLRILSHHGQLEGIAVRVPADHTLDWEVSGQVQVVVAEGRFRIGGYTPPAHQEPDDGARRASA